MLSAGTLVAQDASASSMNCCQMMGMHKGDMMQWHQKLMEKFKAQNDELEKLVSDMNAATGDKKMDAMATVINKMMEQRKTWYADMEAHHQKMMDWMKNKMGKTPMTGGTAASPQ